MRFAFAGTASFAELVLEGLIEADATPLAVVTNPDRPRGRHGTPQPPAIKLIATERGLPVLQPQHVSAREAVAELLALDPEVFVVCAYGQIVGQRPARRSCRPSSSTRRWCRAGAAPRLWSAPSWRGRPSWA